MEETNQDLFNQLGKETLEVESVTTTTNSEQNAFDKVETALEEEMVTPPKMEDDYEFGDVSNGNATKVKFEPEDYDEEKEESKEVFTIEKVEILKPRTRDEEGNLIPPKSFNPSKPDSKKGYSTKIKITYKDSDYVSLIPNIKWYPGFKNPATGKQSLNPWFNIKGLTEEKLKDNFTSEISKLYFRFCKKFDIENGKLSQQQFINELPGKKVKLTQWSTDYNGMKYRIDIKEFI